MHTFKKLTQFFEPPTHSPAYQATWDIFKQTHTRRTQRVKQHATSIVMILKCAQYVSKYTIKT